MQIGWRKIAAGVTPGHPFHLISHVRLGEEIYALRNGNVSFDGIFVVQGTSVINFFPWAYAGPPCHFFCEGNLAVTNVVSTNWLGNAVGAPPVGIPGTAGQYTLSGTPTGTSWSDTPPLPVEMLNDFQDGTSDGTHNYTVDTLTGNVIATDLNWQNPLALFSLPNAFGITYDPNNNSLWFSVAQSIFDYSLTHVAVFVWSFRQSAGVGFRSRRRDSVVFLW
jgi:hypothetical protein